MKKNNFALLVFINLLLMLCLIMGGCNTAARRPVDPAVPAPSTPAPTAPTVPGTPNTAPTPNAPNAPGATDPNANTTQNTELANKVATEADKVSGVQKANVLVVEKNIYIGLDLQPNIEKTRSNKIETTVTEKIKAMQPDYNVIVASDADMVTRISKVVNGIAQGTPMTTFQNEIELIVNRLNPQTR